MEASQENLYVDLGAGRVKNPDDGVVGLRAHELPAADQQAN